MSKEQCLLRPDRGGLYTSHTPTSASLFSGGKWHMVWGLLGEGILSSSPISSHVPSNCTSSNVLILLPHMQIHQVMLSCYYSVLEMNEVSVGTWGTDVLFLQNEFETSTGESSYKDPANCVLPALVFKLELHEVLWNTIFHDYKPWKFLLSIKKASAALTMHKTCISKCNI